MNLKVCLIALLACFTLVHGQNSFCLTADAADLIETGTFASDFRLDLMAKDWIFRKTVSYQIPSWGFDVVATVSKFEGLDYSASYFVFAVKTRKEGNNAVFTIPGGNGWSLLAIDYLITSRDDVTAANWVLASGQWSQYAQQQNLRAVTKINRKLSSSFTYGVAVWISGITTRDLYFQFSFLQKMYIPETQDLFIEAAYDSVPKVEADLIISYVIYPINHQYLTFSTEPSTNPSIYQMAGVASFNPHPFNKKLRIYKHDLIPCLDESQDGNRCPKKCVSPTDCKSIPSAYTQAGRCGLCPSTDRLTNGQCTQSCKSIVYNKCICSPGYTSTNNRACTKNIIPRCGQNQIYNPEGLGSCRKCPPKSIVDPNNWSSCLCQTNYEYDVLFNQCIAVCLSFQQKKSAAQCQCLDGYVLSNGQCIRCQINSSPSRDRTTCECNKATIWDSTKKVCVKCERNQLAKNVNGQINCVCRDGYFKVDSKCTLCDPALLLVSNGVNCECKSGYFKVDNKCITCDRSCSKCSGPTDGQCLSCSDSNLSPIRGYCRKELPCRINTYFDAGICRNCIQNCILCSNSKDCQKCENGYAPKQVIVSGLKQTSCEEICGDGVLLSAECDDKNKNNNDGCNQFCKVEPGWACTPDPINRKSQCNLITSKAVQLISINVAAYTFDGFIVAIGVKNLPECATRNNCSQCPDMFSISTDNSQMTWTVKLKESTSYQFYINFKYTFQRVYEFNAIIQLNNKWSSCFTAEDMKARLDLNIIRDVFDEPPFESSPLTLEDIIGPR